MTSKDDPTQFRPGLTNPPRKNSTADKIRTDATRIREIPATEPQTEFRPGTIIKGRFKLLECLGGGGMGQVYKALDLIKYEAQDRHPYLAIKVLSEDFKDHPEAYIAFQRESSKQQRLAHPNIATVYDFDRIASVDSQIYITMELLEGLPLDTYIKTRVQPKGGLPFKQAFALIKGIASALSYAHLQNIIHSDLKPGNIFLCNDGNVKVLDFGIARAAHDPSSNVEQKTLFDPSKLEAYTPAYASPEMLEGMPADPRNDIFALGCVSYELLTGKHPFNSLSARQARDCNLTPPPISTLNRQQRKALLHSLAFKREDRTPTVAQFLHELEGKSAWFSHPAIIAATVILAVGLLVTSIVQLVKDDPNDAGIQIAKAPTSKFVVTTPKPTTQPKPIAQEKTATQSDVPKQPKYVALPAYIPGKTPAEEAVASETEQQIKNQITAKQPPGPVQKVPVKTTTPKHIHKKPVVSKKTRKPVKTSRPAKKYKKTASRKKTTRKTFAHRFTVRKGTMMQGELKVFVINRKSDKVEIILQRDIVGGTRTLPKGTRLYGTKKYNASTRRLDIRLTQGKTPKDEAFKLRATVYDSKLIKGLSGLVTESKHTTISVPPQAVIIRVDRTF